jgi:ubiquinone biosynthesis protein
VTQGTRDATAGSWLSALDGALARVEEMAWDLRALGERAREGWRELEQDWNALASDAESLASELGRWPTRSLRLAATSWLVTEVALSYRLHAIRAAFLPEDVARDELGRLHARNARRFQESSARHGGGLLKIGQILSSRPDLLPESWITELSRLQDATSPIEFEVVRQVVEDDLGAPLEALFDEFDPTPIGSASIAQVHRARMPDGAVVAVKVRRPGVESLLDLDLGLLELFVAGVRSLLPDADWTTITVQVREAVSAELDFSQEALVMDRVAEYFSDHPEIRVPRSRPDRCSERVLTATFFDGRRITEVLDEAHGARDAGDREAGARLDRTLGLLLEAYFRMVLEAGVFQADPHPGNFLVTDAGELVVLDFGCSRELPASRRRRYLELVRAVLAGERERAAVELADLGFRTRSGGPGSLLAFADALLGAFRRMVGGGEVWLDRAALEAELRDLLAVVADDPVTQLPDDFVMLGRVFGTLGGLFQHHRPAIDWLRHVGPVLGGALYSPSNARR